MKKVIYGLKVARVAFYIAVLVGSAIWMLSEIPCAGIKGMWLYVMSKSIAPLIFVGAGYRCTGLLKKDFPYFDVEVENTEEHIEVKLKGEDAK